MVELVSYPSARAVPGNGNRSRKPLIVFGPRGQTVPRSRWTIEEAAVLTTKESASYPAWYLGPHIEINPSDDDRMRAAFAQLYVALAGDAWLGFAGICVPRWAALPALLQERLLVAAAHEIRADLRDSSLGPFRLEPRERPIRVLISGTPTAPRLTPPRPRRPFVTSQANHVQYLSEHLPTVEQVSQEWTRNIDRGAAAHRTFEAAGPVARDLRQRGFSRPEISDYLEVFGYQNSKGYVGVWPEKRLKEVAEVTR